MIPYETRVAYKEVNEILEIMGKEYKEKMDPSVRFILKKNEAKDFQTQIQPHISLENQIISRKALAILTVLNYAYWVERTEEKEKLKEVYEENSRKQERQLREQYNIETLFQKKKERIKERQEKETLSLVPVKQNVFQKIKSFFLTVCNKRK